MNSTWAKPALRWGLSVAIAACAAGGVRLDLAQRALAGTFEFDTCQGYTLNNGEFIPHADRGMKANDNCGQPWPNGTNLAVQSGPGVVPAGTHASWGVTAPPGLSIVAAVVPEIHSYNVNMGTGWGGGFFYGGSGSAINFSTASFGAFMNSSYFGFQIVCGKATCNGGTYLGFITVSSIRLSILENTGPWILAKTPLYSQTGWIRGTWPLAFTTDDVSGVCHTQANVDGQPIEGPTSSQNHTAWHQCSVGGFLNSVNTADHPNGPMSLALVATNAAGVSSAPTATLHVDNTPVGLSISGPDQNAWIGHGTTLTATATAGPSGVSGIDCGQSGGTASWTAGSTRQVVVDGTGVHTLACNAGNNARDASGGVASSPSVTRVVRIDESPPSIAFEADNSSDPEQVTVDTADGQSGAAEGSVQIRRAGGAWSSLPTQFDGYHLLARFNDAGLRGAYELQATACDAVGNCTSTDRPLTMPVRLGSVSSVSFARVVNPLRAHRVRKRVRVGWHWVTILRNGRKVHVKRGGHVRTITIVHWKPQCAHKRVKVAPRRWRVKTVCERPRLVLKSKQRVRHGRSVVVHGLLRTTQGLPIGGAPVRVLGAPNNGSHAFFPLTTATTDVNGLWSAKVPAGPSRIIAGVFDGSATLQPAIGKARTIVPAAVKLIRVTPRRVAWGGTVKIVGQLRGGYLPTAGALVRLRIGYGKAFVTYAVKEHVRGGGRFTTTYRFGAGVSSIHRRYRFQIASLPTGDYPYAPARSGAIGVIVGGHPPVSRHHRHRQRRPRRR